MLSDGAIFERLIGTWEGTGSGRFPTIDPFRYREVLTFRERAGDDSIHYEQRTWLVPDGEEDGDPSHWESGFLLMRENGVVELLNAQSSGRVEVLSARPSLSERELELVFDSVLLAHDERMLATRRTWKIDQDEFRYNVRMATTKVEELEPHLVALLVRRR